jgi:Flp pilus assembly protein TadG
MSRVAAIAMLQRLRRDRRGVAAMEFVVIGGIMVVLLVGTFDFGNAAQQQLALQQAVRAGAAYAQYFPAATQSNIQGAVTSAAASQGLTLGATPQVSCACNGTAYTCGSPPSNCPPPATVTISANTAYTALGSLFASLITQNTASYEVRIR